MQIFFFFYLNQKLNFLKLCDLPPLLSCFYSTFEEKEEQENKVKVKVDEASQTSVTHSVFTRNVNQKHKI